QLHTCPSQTFREHQNFQQLHTCPCQTFRYVQNFPCLNAAPRQSKKTQNPLQQGFYVLNNKLFLSHSQIFQNFFKVIREPCLELETFTALGMCESDGACVQHLA